MPAGELLNEFVILTLFDSQSLRAVLFQAAPLIMVGLAGCLAFRARFWNLGLEGQMIWGAVHDACDWAWALSRTRRLSDISFMDRAATSDELAELLRVPP